MAVNELELRRRKIIASQPHLETVSGAVATFIWERFPLKLCKASISPVQDLHGYEHPWPAGGGKNKLFAGAKNETRQGLTVTAIGDGSSFIVNGTTIVNTAYTLTTGAKAPEKLLSGETYTISGGHWANTQVAYVQLVYKCDTTGNIISIVSVSKPETITLAEDATLEGIYINFVAGNTFTNDLVQPQFEVGSTATAFSPYSNICPITGWTGAKVTRTGKNLLPESDFNTNASGSTSKYLTTIVKPKKGERIVVSGKATDGTVLTTSNCAINFKNATSTIFAISPTQNKEVPDLSSVTRIEIFTVPALANKRIQIQIEYGSTATAYEPYSGQTVDVQFPSEAGTVYGGSLDVTNGVLTVDRAMVDLGTLDWYLPSEGYFSAPNTINCNPAVNQWIAPIGICDRYKVVASHYVTVREDRIDKSITWVTAQIRIADSGYSDATSFKESLEGSVLVYELATPITYQLTPQEITTLIGTNNVWADTGDVSVTYWKH